MGVDINIAPSCRDSANNIRVFVAINGSKSISFYEKTACREPIFAIFELNLSRYIIKGLFNPFIESGCEHVDIALWKPEPMGFGAP